MVLGFWVGTGGIIHDLRRHVLNSLLVHVGVSAESVRAHESGASHAFRSGTLVDIGGDERAAVGPVEEGWAGVERAGQGRRQKRAAAGGCGDRITGGRGDGRGGAGEGGIRREEERKEEEGQEGEGLGGVGDSGCVGGLGGVGERGDGDRGKGKGLGGIGDGDIRL